MQLLQWRDKSKRALNTIITTAFLATQIIVPVSTLSHASALDPSGNNGTLQVHEQDSPIDQKSNEPKVCVFNFEVFGVDAGQTGDVIITPQGASSSNGTPDGKPLVLSITTDTLGNGDSAYVNSTNLAIALANGHYKATLDNKFGTDHESKAKSKVFKVVCDSKAPDPAQPTVDVSTIACTPNSATSDVLNVKVTNIADATDAIVTYTVSVNSGGTTVATQTLADLADGANGTLHFTGLTAGTYTAVVSGNDETGPITSKPIEVGSCPGVVSPSTITVTKHVVNNNGGRKTAKDFTLMVNGKSVSSGTTNTYAASKYTVSEIDPSSLGYEQTSLVCTNDAKQIFGASFTLIPAENVSCTITNDDIAPSLRVTKHVINDDAGTKMASDFKLYVNGSLLDDAGIVGDEIGESSVTYENPDTEANTSYVISEDADNGYAKQSQVCVDNLTEQTVIQPVVLQPGQTVECTITNNDIPYNENAPTLTIIKDANPNDPQVFNFTLEKQNTCEQVSFEKLISINRRIVQCESSYSSVDNFQLVDHTDPSLARKTEVLSEGTYKLHEASTAGWDLTGLTCTGADATVDGSSMYLTVLSDQNVTCTFTNTKKAKVTIVKDAQPNSSQMFNFTTMLGDDFSLVDDGSNDTAASKSFTNLKPGTYTVTETATSGWKLASVSCGKGVETSVVNGTLSVVVAPGANLTCTFVNTKITGDVLGIFTTATPPSVLAAKAVVAPAELAKTGESIWVNVIVSLTIATAAFGLTLASRKQQIN